jgi:acylglycerol lipase
MTATPWTFDPSVRGYRWSPAAQPRATLLLAHGFGEYSGRYVEHYHGLIPALTGMGIAVHGFDLPGHGGSPGRRGVVDLAQAVELHLRARRALAGSGPLFLLGHSLGGLLTAASVARDGTGVAGVVLSAPALLLEAPAMLKLVGRVLARIAPAAGIRPPLDPAGISRIAAEVEAYRADPQVYRGKLPALTGASALAVAEEGWRRYAGWTAPVLVLHGTADGFTDPRGSERFVAAVSSTDTHLEWFAEGRHELLNDLERDRARTTILDWIAARLG